MKDKRYPTNTAERGNRFEKWVAVHYYTAGILKSPAQGFHPTTKIIGVHLQASDEDFPMDDIIVFAKNQNDEHVILEIQATISLSTNGKKLEKTIEQAIQGFESFKDEKHLLAVAIPCNTDKINNWKEVFLLARNVRDSEEFFKKLAKRNQIQNLFVKKIEKKFSEKNSIYQFFKRFQILIFDIEEIKRHATQIVEPDSYTTPLAVGSILYDMAWENSCPEKGYVSISSIKKELKNQGCRLAGDRNFSIAIILLNEQSDSVLSDIKDRVNNVNLSRKYYDKQIQDDENKLHIQFVGKAGVGKSALAKKFIENKKRQGCVVLAFNPSRTVPGGWGAMRATIEFKGTARELMEELATRGKIYIFIDDQNVFSKEQQLTVLDFVNAGADLEVSIVITKRTSSNFSNLSEGDELEINNNWLNLEEKNTRRVLVEELTNNEIAEMQEREEFSKFTILFDKSHPAQKVYRNLFFLNVFIKYFLDTKECLCEESMIEAFFKLPHLKDSRAVRREIRKLAEASLNGNTKIKAKNFDAKVIDILLEEQILTEIRFDHLTFSHDILKEWAIADLLSDDIEQFDTLETKLPIPEYIARALELTSRILIQKDFSSWEILFKKVNETNVNPTWKYQILLGFVRSESGLDYLKKQKSFFLNNPVVLQTLIKIVVAIESRSALEVWSVYDVEPSRIPKDLKVFSSLTPSRLVLWLITVNNQLPECVIIDTIDIYIQWCYSFLGKSTYTSFILEIFYKWLIEIKTLKFTGTNTDEAKYSILRKVKKRLNDIRITFLRYCDRTPELAIQYLDSLISSPVHPSEVHIILKYSSQLSKINPEKFSQFLEKIFIYQSDFDFEMEFFPVSSKNGLFYDFLKHSPKQAIALIHKLVGQQTHDPYIKIKPNDTITISFPDGSRTFFYKNSYSWVRKYGVKNNIVSSALMTLKEWAQEEILQKQEFEKVIYQILPESEGFIAYLLIIVDLIILNWPTSLNFSIPFLASPDLLILDRTRIFCDEQESERLNNSYIPEYSLYDLLCKFFLQPKEIREKLYKLLENINKSLGPIDLYANIGDPKFMVFHALNIINPDNWQKIETTLPNGMQGSGYKYILSKEEQQQQIRIQENKKDNLSESIILTKLPSLIIDEMSSLKEIELIKDWYTKAFQSKLKENYFIQYSLLCAAMILVRSLGCKLSDEISRSAIDIFEKTLLTEDFKNSEFVWYQDPFNIAFFGIIYSLKHQILNYKEKDFLKCITITNTKIFTPKKISVGFFKMLPIIKDINENLPSSILRCIFAFACKSNDNEAYINAIIEKEVNWLNNLCKEPEWPEFGMAVYKKEQLDKKNLISNDIRNDNYLQCEKILPWLQAFEYPLNISQHKWLISIVEKYFTWTIQSTELEIKNFGSLPKRLRNWNKEYFLLVAQFLSISQAFQINDVIGLICKLSNKDFFEIAHKFLLSIDLSYFSKKLQSMDCLPIVIREKFLEKFIELVSSQYSLYRTSSEEHFLSAFFFNVCDHSRVPKLYPHLKNIENIRKFFPVLLKLIIFDRASNSISEFTAILILNLLELNCESQDLEFLITIIHFWLVRFSNDIEFWGEKKFALRINKLIKNLLDQDKKLLMDERLRTILIMLATPLIDIGLAEGNDFLTIVNNFNKN